MSPRTIRPARPDDLAAVSALLADSYPTLLAPDYPADVLARVLPFIAKAKPNLLASGTYHVAHDASGQLLAGGGWTAVAPGAEATVPGVGHIRHVVANPKTLRQGHARAVLEVSLRQAKTAGIRRMCCLSTLTARDFYGRLGFVPMSERDVLIGPERVPFPSVEMALTL